MLIKKSMSAVSGKPSTFTHDEEMVDYLVALSKFGIRLDVPTLQKVVQDYDYFSLNVLYSYK